MDIHKRRFFLQQLLKGGTVAMTYPWLLSYDEVFADLEEEGNDERYWKKVHKEYDIKSDYINLNNAGCNPQPKVVREAVAYYEDLCNQLPSYYMWTVLKKERGQVKSALAQLVGCVAEDIALVRNTTEGLQTIISGMQFENGDEVVLSKHDYPHMKFAWKQRAKRDKINLKWVSLDLPSEDKDYLINQYAEQITEKTKLVCITHITNWNGQVMPLKEIAKIAKANGAEVLVDAAHTVGQRPIHIQELDIDYLASSLHKWIGAPFGTGLLYVSEAKRKDIFPLFAGPNPASKNIAKFEHQGTLAVSHERSILPALVFHNSIGTERKMKRLLFLKNYIVAGIKDIPGLEIQSPLDEEFGSAILLVKHNDMEVQQLIGNLKNDWNIHTTKSKNEMLNGVRISPNINTRISELDTFIEAMRFLLVNK